MILSSIAAEETALSRVIEAEGEKIQHAVNCFESGGSAADADILIAVNNSAACLLEKASDMQLILKNKLSTVISGGVCNHGPCRPCPCPPGHEPGCKPNRPRPCPLKTSCFEFAKEPGCRVDNCGEIIWRQTGAGVGVKLTDRGKAIYMPKYGQYKIEYHIAVKADGAAAVPFAAELLLFRGNSLERAVVIKEPGGVKCAAFHGAALFETRGLSDDYRLSVIVSAAGGLRVERARLLVTEADTEK
jgi:hypothetical protein